MTNSPSGKHIGAEPSQHPPDWWNINGPWTPVRRRTSAAASPVTSTRLGVVSSIGSEEAEGVGAVADEEVLRLLVVLEHHLVGLATDAALLVAAEGRVGGVRVVVVRPHPAGLDLATGPVGAVPVARPHAGAEA